MEQKRKQELERELERKQELERERDLEREREQKLERELIILIKNLTKEQIMTKAQKRWKLEAELKRFLLKGGVVQKLKTGVPANYHPYDVELGKFGSYAVDSKFQIKKSF